MLVKRVPEDIFKYFMFSKNIILHQPKLQYRMITCMHYDDVIMSAIASQITSLAIVYSTVYPGADQSKHQSSASLAFVWGIHRWPVNSPHKWPVTRKMFTFDEVIMAYIFIYKDSKGHTFSKWSETYFRQNLFPVFLFSMRQIHAIKIFRLKWISDTDSGSHPRLYGESIYTKLKTVVS